MAAASARLWNSRRWVQAVHTPATGRVAFWAGTFYGFADARTCPHAFRRNEALIRDIRTMMAVAGQLPAMVGRDFNVQV